MQPGPSRPLSTRPARAARGGSDGGPPRPKRTRPRSGPRLSAARIPSAAKSQVLHDLSVALDLRGFQVVEEPPALPHHAEEAAARCMIPLVNLEVLGQVVDLLGEERDLHFGRTRITFMRLELLDDAQLLLLGKRQRAGS